MRLREFAPAGGGGSGDYFQALASAWYNGTFDTGSLQKGIKSQQDVERLLNRGIVCPDGKTRKLHIDYNSDFDGVEIYSDDYYEHGDESGELDSRTGQKWGPYDFMAFSDEDLSEGLNEVDRRGFLRGVGAAAVGAGATLAGQKYLQQKQKVMPNDPVAWYLMGVVTGLWMESSAVNDWGDQLEPYLQNASLQIQAGGLDKKLEDAYNKGYEKSHYYLEGNKGNIKREHIQLLFGGGFKKLKSMLNVDESVEQGVAEGLNEFAANDGDSGGEDDALHKYARMWWAGDEATQMQIERALARMGWEIGEDEGSYDNGGVFVVRAGDINGDSYVSWAAEDLTEGVWDNIKKSFTPDPNWQKRAGQAAGHVAQGAVAGGAHGHAVGHAMADTGVHEGSNYGVDPNNPWGSQGRFVGDTGPAQITATVPRHEFRAGDRVMYKPTGARATIENLYKNGTVARIHVASGMGGQYFDAKVADLRPIGQGSLEEKSTSQAQFRTMAAAAHDPKFAKKVGIKQSVAREFNKADKGQSYKSLPKKAD
jgi:hypothetical protein